MGMVKIGNEEYVWGPEAETLPLDIRGEGERILNLADANAVKNAIDESGEAVVPDLSECFAVNRERGSRRRVVVNTPGKPAVPLFVWARPEEAVPAGSTPPAGTNEGGAAEPMPPPQMSNESSKPESE